ncbi:hypothetical protein [Pontibacillus litoralis]|uniref:Uncharacterized protein n=1 Tax=Pontibacillus litoralis JSM 072002 TaxID=1385512 RepID=A0A0A5HMI2_9BACI|nr:hypothetical protein [Pontibacillus litoralis]KGX84837.1 hypothetical protein N784_11715 [Pontibacillus litoralis JSM 072002]
MQQRNDRNDKNTLTTVDAIVDEEETIQTLEQVRNNFSTACEYHVEQSVYMVANAGSYTK